LNLDIPQRIKAEDIEILRVVELVNDMYAGEREYGIIKRFVCDVFEDDLLPPHSQIKRFMHLCLARVLQTATTGSIATSGATSGALAR
jgi:hypothetical protein